MTQVHVEGSLTGEDDENEDEEGKEGEDDEMESDSEEEGEEGKMDMDHWPRGYNSCKCTISRQ